MLLVVLSLVLPFQGLAPGHVFTQSTVLKRGTYRLVSTDVSGESAALTVRGDDIVLDFRGAVLEGSAQSALPNDRTGTGLLVEGNNITIKNLVCRGYKVGMVARNSRNLKIVDCDFSYNWKQRLASTLEREDASDWMSFHHNEKDEWLRYGAGIYLKGCSEFEVRNAKIVGGQCGLMLTNCNFGKVINCNFSFLSGIGLGLYRSSNNRIFNNKIDWCVRGFSYGVYNRGQDSAGILIYEQSHRNIFAFNSATHGGDGFFLWAGQTTMDSGKGGCNDNILYGNDFSHAPANGIEATFSRNVFANNLMLECWHGIWGGYSYDTSIVGNKFGFNAESIAIEHGQDISVIGNSFYRDEVGINIWANERAPDPDWGYPKHRDTRSMVTSIASNIFSNIRTETIRLRNTENVAIRENLFENNGAILASGGKTKEVLFSDNVLVGVGVGRLLPTGVEASGNVSRDGQEPLPAASALNQGIAEKEQYLSRFAIPWDPYLLPKTPKDSSGPLGRKAVNQLSELVENHRLEPIAGIRPPFLSKQALRGWRYILVDEWGPYDFQRPIVWPRGVDKNGGLQFELLGPKGMVSIGKNGDYITSIHSPKIEGLPGIPTDFEIPAMIVVHPPTYAAMNFKLEFEYRGAKTIDYRGIVTPAGKPVVFGYSSFIVPIDWTVKFYKWKLPSDPTNPRSAPEAEELQKVWSAQPLKTLKLSKLDFAGSSFDNSVGSDHFSTIAEGEFEIEKGVYDLELTTDDGARLYLDDQLVISDSWKYQGPTVYKVSKSLGGKHRLRIEHFQIDGYATLQFRIRPSQ